MALHVPVLNEFHMVKDEMSAIPEVESAYIESDRQSLDITVIVADNNPTVLDKIIAVETSLTNTFPWLDIDVDIVFRCGRPLNELLSPKGSLLFAR